MGSNDENEIGTEEKSESPFTSEKEQDALCLVKRHMYGSAGAGLIPIPIVDMLSFIGIQMNMVRCLASLYDVEFKSDLVKPAIASLLGGVAPMLIAAPIASMLKVIPGVGHLMGALTVPALGGAATYAVGKVFIQHFEAGGTFLDLDPAKVKEYFAEQFKEGKNIVADMKN